MEFDWHSPPFPWNGELSPEEIEESFEDPFAVRLLPDSKRFAGEARYFNLGCTSKGKGIFSLYRTNGKQVRVIAARPFTEEEWLFYNRRMSRLLGA